MTTAGPVAYHDVLYMRRIKVIRVLLERGADVGAEDKPGMTPFSAAKKHAYEEIMKLLSGHGAE
jgi:ankyrin repeat protein